MTDAGRRHARVFDAVVIGAGPAGRTAAGRLADGGRDVAIVERELVGGECSFWACMPAKALLRPQELLAEVARVPGAAEAEAVGAHEVDVTATLKTPRRGHQPPRRRASRSLAGVPRRHGRARLSSPGGRADFDRWTAATDYDGRAVCHDREIDCMELFDDPFHVVLPGGRRLADAPVIELPDLAGERVIGSPSLCSPWGADFRALCENAGFEPNFEPRYRGIEQSPACEAMIAVLKTATAPMRTRGDERQECPADACDHVSSQRAASREGGMLPAEGEADARLTGPAYPSLTYLLPDGRRGRRAGDRGVGVPVSLRSRSPEPPACRSRRSSGCRPRAPRSAPYLRSGGCDRASSLIASSRTRG